VPRDLGLVQGLHAELLQNQAEEQQLGDQIWKMPLYTGPVTP
jgi:hypothetical protein